MEGKMDKDRERFARWFSGVLQYLESPDHAQDAGAILLMASFPLLERYLRNKCRQREDVIELPAGFHVELTKVFPTLGGEGEAKEFWKRWRHGLMHRVMLNDEKDRWEVKDGAAIVEGDSKKGFRVNPVKFSRHVRETIASDLATFMAGKHLGVDPYGGTGTRMGSY